MLKNASICLAALVIASVAWAATPSTQLQVGSMPSCRHADNPTQADRVRASQAVALAKRINAAESEAVKRSGKYEPVASLRALPTTPDGFKIYLYVDGTGYLFSLKDTLDPCHFAIFSDAAGLVYQQSALTAPVVAQ